MTPIFRLAETLSWYGLTFHPMNEPEQRLIQPPQQYVLNRIPGNDPIYLKDA